jgi:hypothetical protein
MKPKMSAKSDVTSEFQLQIVNLNRLAARCSWISWWIQIILTVVSFVILSFANAVRNGTNQQAVTSGFFFSTLGVLVAFLNSFSTWNFTRLTRRIVQGKTPQSSVLKIFRKYASISIGISLVGMFLSLIGAEQIVGTLASKVLSTQSFFTPAPGLIAQPPNALQALDIFLVQANTNCLVSHYAPLAIYTWFQYQLPFELIPLVSSTNSSTTSGVSK